MACRSGLGTLIAKLGEGLPVALSTPVTRIEWSKRDVSIQTAAGRIAARAAILTVSSNVLASGAIKFEPELPKRYLDAAAKLSLGSCDRIALQLAGNRLGLAKDEIVIEQSRDARTAFLAANLGGSSLCTIDVAGSFGRDLSAQGEAAMIAFGKEWLSKLFGSDAVADIQRSQRDALERRAFRAGRDVGGSARRTIVAAGAGRADRQSVHRRRSQPRNAVGHGGRRLGIRRARRRRRLEADRRAEERRAAGAPRASRRSAAPRKPPDRRIAGRGRADADRGTLCEKRRLHRILGATEQRQLFCSSASTCRCNSSTPRNLILDRLQMGFKLRFAYLPASRRVLPSTSASRSSRC